MLEAILRLPDGRDLGYGIYGNPAGLPILEFHGTPGSRREAALIASYIERDDVCFIGVDRPGYGRSSPKHHFTPGDLPGDVTALLNHLEITRCAALGYSGGGPFALACAVQIPERLASLAIVSGLGPASIGAEGMHEGNKKKYNLAQQNPSLAKILLSITFSGMRRHPDRLAAQLKKIWAHMPDPDRLVLEQDQHFADSILSITRDAMYRGVSGWAHEEILLAQAWNFRIEDIRGPSVYLWHGCQDGNVPVAMGKAMAARIPGCQATFLEDEGHVSILYHHGRQIVDTLIQSGFST